uniref:Uncharacterized protein n=1 Tax=Oryza glaberrima TaxID=4538 RepID=I1NPL3_ORYGL
MTSLEDENDGSADLPIPRPVAAELCKYDGGLIWGTNWLRIRHAAASVLPSSHPDYTIDCASASFVTRRLNDWDWGPVSNGGNRRLATRIKSSVQQAAMSLCQFRFDFRNSD